MTDDRTPIVFRLPNEPQARAPDGVHYIPPRGIIEHLESHLVQVDSLTGRLGPRQACCLAVAQVLANLTFVSFDLQAFARGADQAALRFGLKDLAVSFDWAEPAKDKAFVNFNIADDQPLTYEDMGLGGSVFLEDTVDVFGPGTVLVQDGFISGTLVVRTSCTDKNHREAVIRAVEEGMAREPFSPMVGRRVVSRLYYDRPIRLTLSETPFMYPDEANEAVRNEYPVDIRIEIDAERVRLVPRPAIVTTPPMPRISVSTDELPE